MADFVERFLNSDYGAKAREALGQHGIAEDEATKYLSTAAETARDHSQEHAENHGLLGEHPGRNFFAAFAAGIVKGDGFLGSLGDGFQGVLAGRIAEALCNKTGLDSNVASTVAATAAPFVVDFVKNQFEGC